MIKYETPPNWNEIRDHFPVEWGDVICTYGENIYTARPISMFKIVHESVHVKQQTDMDKDEWWNNYFEDPQFRLKQELEAYRAEIKEIKKKVKDREIRYKMIRDVILDVSSPMYGGIISYEEAKKLLQ